MEGYYVFKRVGQTTPLYTQHEYYLVRCTGTEPAKWIVKNDTGGWEEVLGSMESKGFNWRKYNQYAYRNSAEALNIIDEFNGVYDDPDDEEIQMAHNDVLEIRAVTQINGVNIESFSDKQLVCMIQAEQKKLAELEVIGFVSTHITGKITRLKTNISHLIKLLDLR